MKKLRNYVVWALANFSILALAICNLVYGMVWAGRIVTFLTVLPAVLLTFALFHTETGDAGRERKEQADLVPMWVNTTFDFGMLLLFVGAGWWFLAVLKLWKIMAYVAVYSDKEMKAFRERKAEQIKQKEAEQKQEEADFPEELH